MKTKWIVENFTHESSYMDLVKAIKDSGSNLKEIKKDFKFSDLEEYNQDAPVIFLGSIEMTKIAQQQLPNCHPVAYCNQENYLCSKYMTHFGKYLFNDKYAMMSLSEFQRQKFLYYGMFGKEAVIFIRPDSGQKPFQAQLMDMLDIDRFCENNKHLEHELVVISTPKKIKWEGRFITSKYKEIIAYSTYRFQDQICKIPSSPQGAIDLVKEMLEVGYYPDSVFCMDVCEDNDGKYWLLELNSFSSAGLYACNKVDIVNKVSSIADGDWDKWAKDKQSF